MSGQMMANARMKARFPVGEGDPDEIVERLVQMWRLGDADNEREAVQNEENY